MTTSFSGGRSRKTGNNHRNWQATGKLYHLRLYPFRNLQSQGRPHCVLLIGLYELLGKPTTLLIEPSAPPLPHDPLGQVD